MTCLLLVLADDVKKRASPGQASPDELRRLYLGPQGELARLSKLMRLVPAQDRQQVGRLLNEVKQVVETSIATAGGSASTLS